MQIRHTKPRHVGGTYDLHSTPRQVPRHSLHARSAKHQQVGSPPNLVTTLALIVLALAKTVILVTGLGSLTVLIHLARAKVAPVCASYFSARTCH